MSNALHCAVKDTLQRFTSFKQGKFDAGRAAINCQDARVRWFHEDITARAQRQYQLPVLTQISRVAGPGTGLFPNVAGNLADRKTLSSLTKAGTPGPIGLRKPLNMGADLIYRDEVIDSVTIVGNLPCR